MYKLDTIDIIRRSLNLELDIIMNPIIRLSSNYVLLKLIFW